MVERVDQKGFEDALKSGAVLADFYSESCIPCKRMSPVFSEVEKECGDRIKAVKINVASDGELAERYSVRAVPTFILFRNGVETSRVTGAVPKAELEQMINQ